MKIALINVALNGSTGKIMTDTALAAAALGNECRIYYGRGQEKSLPNIKFIRIGRDADVYFHVCKARFAGKNGFGSKKSTEKLVRDLKEYDPDVIQIHNIHGYYINIDILFKYLKETKAKIFWTLHDCWSMTGGCAFFTSAGCEKWKNQCGKCEMRGYYPKSYVDTTQKQYEKKKQIFTGVPNLTLVTPCLWLSDIVRESYLREYECVCIPNGISTEDFNEKNEEGTGDNFEKIGGKYVLGVASIWDERKKPELFIKTAKILTKKGFGSVMIGKMDEKYKKQAENQGIIVIDRTENRKILAGLYRRALCTLSTSGDDTFPTIGLESMACGTPVVYADVCGCREQVLGEPLTGFAVTGDEPEAFAEAVMKIDENSENFRRNCLEKTKNMYTREIMCGKYLKLWNANV